MSKGLRAIVLSVFVAMYVLCVAQIALAASEGGFNYNIQPGNRARVLSYYGTSTTMVVPPTLGGYPVTEIYANAFANNTTVTAVTLPDSVTNIGSAAFTGMTALTRLDFGTGLQQLDTSAIRGCTSLTRVVLPATVHTIRGSVFRSCTSLTAAYFLGNAPTMLDSTVFQSTGPGFTVYVLPTTTGYGTVPGTWYTYPTAYFAYKTIRPSGSFGGAITPGVQQNVIPGDSVTFTFASDPKHGVGRVRVDGVSVGSPASYTFTNVTSDHTIEVMFVSNVPASSDWSLGAAALLALAVASWIWRRDPSAG